MTNKNNTEKISELARRRGFFSQTAEPYGGVAGFYTFGPEGAELKRNIENLWRERFNKKEGHREIEAPTIMPEQVFEASGHLETFDDMIIECPQCSENHRADHLVEDNTNIDEAEAFSPEKIKKIIEDEELECPSCKHSLAGIDVDDFNLMFKTEIGPGDSMPGYLRPETAQGIFVEFPRFKDYARNQLPFGITQIGKAYRNEISPRKAIVRVRELTQAELEHFIDPEEDRPQIEKVEDVEVTLYSANDQERSETEYKTIKIGEAVEENIIESEWVAYYLGIAQKWYKRIGLDMDRFRYRQHLKDERSHYATDCWDAEAEVDGDWIEITGFAYRGCYDLTKHQEHSGEDYTIFKEYEEPKKIEEKKINPDMGYLGPKYGNKTDKIIEKLSNLAENSEEVFENEEVTITVESEEINIPTDKIGFEVVETEKTGERIIPHVVEPSFGIDRLVYTVIEHAYNQDEIEGESRTYLSLDPEVAPTLVAVFPLMKKDGLDKKARELTTKLREHRFSVAYDDSGTIGKRYRRQDEIGTPYSVTVDHETLDDNSVTIRHRDSTEQVRVKIEELNELLNRLKSGEISFSDL